MIPIVHVDQRRNFTSTTLPPPSLEKLASTFRAVRFWQDKWSHRGFRAVAREVLREHEGLILIGPRVRFEVPEPFNEFFEPIEIGSTFGGNRRQLRVLSGDAPTRQERWAWVAWVAIVFAVLFMVIPFVMIFLKGIPAHAACVFLGIVTMAVLVPVFLLGLRRLGGRWFLVPGAIAIVRRPRRHGIDPRVTVLSSANTCLVLRYVQQGKASVLTIELWTHLGKHLRHAVSEREAISILATWQGSHPPPPDERLKELVTW